VVERVEQRVLRFAPLVLCLSLGWYFWRLGAPSGWGMIDLKVYWTLSPNLLTDQLYTIDMPFTADFPLPFTYPPFAAVLFLPLSWLPWVAARIVWQVLSLVCLWWLVRTALTLVAARSGQRFDATWSRRALLWTGLALWCEPVRKTLDFGQINLVLIAGTFAAMVATRQLVAGFGVGVAAGLKLTPAISVLYFLVTRRFKAALWTAAGFAFTVAVGFAASASDSWRYWFELLGAADRVGPVGSAINQSLRGALSRTLGYDVEMTWPWVLAVVVSAVLAGFALRAAVRAGDVLIGVLVVQVLGLLLSPISWDHHWVWIAPLLIWLVHTRIAPWACGVLLVLWTPIMFWDVIEFQLLRQPTIWTIPRPGYLSAIGWAYPALALLTLAVIPFVVKAVARREPANAPLADQIEVTGK
jgi:alpha-1,2-mannosyltransferase